MNESKSQPNEASGEVGIDIPIPLAPLAGELWNRRLRLLAVTAAGLILSSIVAFILPVEFTSTAQLMPPEAQALTSSSLLTALSGSSAMVSGLGGGLMNARTPGGTSVGILSSRTIQDDLIERFHLKDVYHCKYNMDAGKILKKRTVIEEDRKSGIITISVIDRDRMRAHDLANAYIDELNLQLSNSSTSSARRERIFLEERLKASKASLDAAEKEFSDFSSKNATLDIQGQGLEMLASVGRLQGELVAAQTELAGLRAQYTDDNMAVRELQARINTLQSQLRKEGGVGEPVDGSDLKADQIYPSLRKLPVLGAEYFTLFRRVGVDQSIYELLNKQYELARIQEEKEVPQIRVLDAPNVPEKRSSPHRTVFVLLCTIACALGGAAWIMARKTWSLMDDATPVKSFFAELGKILHNQAAGDPRWGPHGHGRQPV